MKQFLETEEMWSERERLESRMKPRFRAEGKGFRMTFWETQREGLLILASCTGRPIGVVKDC